jgi:hypothetical protein
MKRFAILISLLLSVFVSYSQDNKQQGLAALYTVSTPATSGGPGDFIVSGFMNDPLGIYTVDSVEVGNIVWDASGNRFEILEINSRSGNTISLDLEALTGGTPEFDTGVGCIQNETGMLPIVIIGGLSDIVRQAIDNHRRIVSKYDEIQYPYMVGNKLYLTGSLVPIDFDTVGGSCVRTLTQTAHGFSKAEAIYYNGSSYVSMTGLYGDSQEPHFLVIDSLTANTFKVSAGCGIVDDTLGLSEGLYYSTDTGLSLTPDTVEYPIVKILDGKALPMNLPGFEFNAINKSLFEIETVSGPRTFLGGQTLPMFPDSISYIDTIDGVPVNNLGDGFRELRDRSLVGNLNDLNDVIITTPANNNLLRYMGGQWRNYVPPMYFDTARVHLGWLTNVNRVPQSSVFVGYGAGRFITAGAGVTVLGSEALDGATGDVGTGTTAIGLNALGSASYNTNQPNTAVGGNAGAAITTGYSNTLLGFSAGSALTTGILNVFVGQQAGLNTSSGQGNVGVGYRAGAGLGNGNSSVAVGNDACQTTAPTSNFGVFIGSGAGNSVSGIRAGVLVGNSAGDGTTGLNVCATVGNYIGREVTDMSYAVLIGDRVKGSTNTRMTKKSAVGLVSLGTFSSQRADVSGVFLGTAAGQDSRAVNSIMIGNQNTQVAGTEEGSLANGVRGDSMILIGNSSANIPFDAGLAKTTGSAGDYNTTTDIISIASHGFGAVGDYVQLQVTCTVCPAPLITGRAYMFEVTGTNAIFSNTNLTSAGDGSTVTYTPRTRTNSAITVGLGTLTLPEERKIKLGWSTHRNLIANQYNFNIDQSLTGRNAQALRYNSTSGEIELQAEPFAVLHNRDSLTSVATGTVTATLYRTQLVDCSGGAITVNVPSSPAVGDWFAVSDINGSANTNNITVSFSTVPVDLHNAEVDFTISTSRAYYRFTYTGATYGWIISN